MRLLANENFPRVAVEALRGAGFDVLWARTDMAGADDEAILSRAQAEKRVVVTFDKDFGELAYRWGLPADCGVLLFRFALTSPDFAARRCIDVLQSQKDWQGLFAVADEARVRVRTLPSSNAPLADTDEDHE